MTNLQAPEILGIMMALSAVIGVVYLTLRLRRK